MSAILYTDIDPGACAWARELVRAGLVPQGTVDERSIVDIRPQDLAGCREVHLFAGILGWPLALRLAGWPDGRPVWTGSCPCQPFSTAGRRKAEKDRRHLWPHMRRLIAECCPATVFGEQVASRLGREWLAGVRADLEALGYAVGAADLCAAGVSAPHIRQRLFWVASLRVANAGRAGVWGDGQSVGATARGDQGDEGKRERVRSNAGDGRSTGRLGHTDGTGSQPGRIAAEADGYGRATEPDGGTGRVGDPQSPRCQRRTQPGRDPRTQEGQGSRLLRPEGPGPHGFWDRFDIVPCGDGKARRVEPGTFPLAHGIPNRVGLLRGYGNAIVPQVAATFIRAFLEAEAETELGGGRTAEVTQQKRP